MGYEVPEANGMGFSKPVLLSPPGTLHLTSTLL